MTKRMGIAAAAALLLLAAAPAQAQVQSRELEVPATASWKHAETGMILPPSVAGLRRGPIRDRTAAERDVSAAYEGEDGLTTSVYLFQTPLADAPLWTDRALAAIALRPEFALAAEAIPVPSPYRRPGAAAASGLRAVVPLNASGLTATAVALVPLDGWLVKVRMTSARLDPAALDTKIGAFLDGLRWPAEARAAAAVPVAACPNSLAFPKKARTVRDDVADVLLNAISGSVESRQIDEGKAEPVVYCREPGPLKPYGVYRPNGSRDSYVVAMGDSGTALRLAPSLTLDLLTSGGGGGRRVAMTLLEHDTVSVLPSFNRLPPPDQAIAVAFSGRPRSTISVTTSKGKEE